MLQFGEPIPGARRRPGAYGIIHDPSRGLALVTAGGGGLHVPGGGIEAGEDDRDAVVREVAEETGLTVEVIERIGVVRQAIGHLNKVSHYLWCRVLTEGGPHEPDHELLWHPWEDAARSLELGADRWAIATWAKARGYDASWRGRPHA
ncbi:MAG: NUDIX domain-containing protein [Myxococcota bacterium]